jgi:hypothetical protein
MMLSKRMMMMMAKIVKDPSIEGKNGKLPLRQSNTFKYFTMNLTL